jgi:N-formylmaleamate deformylase
MLDAALQSELDALPATSRFVTSGDLRLHVLDYGGEGRPTIVLPGITSPVITFDFIARELLDVIRPIVVDVRGRGLSGRPADGSYTLSDYAADTAAIVRGLELDKPLVLGHSMGARIAAAFAVEYPELAGDLILVDPPTSGPGRGPYPMSLQAFLDQLVEANAGTTADAMRKYFPRWPEAELELRARWLPTCDEQAVAETHRGFESEDFFDYWPKLPATTVLIRGGSSPVVPEEAAAELAATLPAATIVSVPNAGHMVPWDEFDAFMAALRPHLEVHQEEER